MPEKIQIITDGSCDLPKELTKEKDIKVVPFYVSFDGETYLKEMEELDIREFYQKMVDHPDVFPKTSMPSVDDYYQVFEPLAKEGVPVICICITTKFSGSMQSATTARDMILEQYPDARIKVIDATVNTVLQGLYVLEACRLRDLGWEYDRLVKRILEIRESGRIFFTIGSIDYLKHGGRIGKLAGIAGSALKIKPLITLKAGEIFNSGISRNREKSMLKVIDMLKEYLDEVHAKPGEYSFAVGFGYDYEEACRFKEKLRDLVKERLGIDEITIYQIGATIGVHTGPYPIGVGIIRRADVE
jgi:DegV family protein with EDD domain